MSECIAGADFEE